MKTIGIAVHPYKYFFLLLLLLCLIFSPLFAENTPPQPFNNYNVVLIFIDTLRADHLSCYGYHRKTSPNIDKLAKESFVFEQNFTPVTYTLPSFMSIITSLYPNSHGVLDICKDKLSPRVITLAQILKAYGYKTAWFGPDNPCLSAEVGFGLGVDDFSNAGDSQNLLESRKNIFSWLDKNKDKKFFLNFHTYKVHIPHFPSGKYKQRFTRIKNMDGVMEDKEEFQWRFIKQIIKKELLQNKKLTNEIIGEDFLNQLILAGMLNWDRDQIVDFFFNSGSKERMEKFSALQTYAYWYRINFTDPAVNLYFQSLYDADILEYDEEVIGPVISRLKALNLYDKTIIIIFADHGEEFYEHKRYGHGGDLYDETTHVPLIIRVPWIKEDRRIKELTQTVDIMPTLLDLLEIPIPHQAQGKSLIDLMNNKKSLPLHEYVFGNTHGISSIRSKEWLLVLNQDGRPRLKPKELYSLRSDPKEQKNVYYQNQDVALKLESELKKWEASLPSYKDQEYSFPPEIDEATRERIRKTGYW